MKNKIDSILKELSEQGLRNVLKHHKHITLDAWGKDSKEELEQIAQCNLEEDLIDEIEFIIELYNE